MNKAFWRDGGRVLFAVRLARRWRWFSVSIFSWTPLAPIWLPSNLASFQAVHGFGFGERFSFSAPERSSLHVLEKRRAGISVYFSETFSSS